MVTALATVSNSPLARATKMPSHLVLTHSSSKPASSASAFSRSTSNPTMFVVLVHELEGTILGVGADLDLDLGRRGWRVALGGSRCGCRRGASRQGQRQDHPSGQQSQPTASIFLHYNFSLCGYKRLSKDAHLAQTAGRAPLHPAQITPWRGPPQGWRAELGAGADARPRRHRRGC